MSWQDESDRFATTMWTVVAATGQEAKARGTAVQRLCNAYWLPLYTCLRRSGRNEHDAQDIVQGLEIDYLMSVAGRAS